MRIPVFAGNWKLNKKSADACELARKLVQLLGNVTDAEVVIAPSFTVLGKVSETLSGSKISLAGQNCFWMEEGAFTGEISPGMLADSGCQYVIIGHSERRQYFGETDETVNLKVMNALQSGLKVILCIGETLQERESDETLHVLERQTRIALRGIRTEDIQRITIAYEPVWAIGTGKTATDEQAQEAHSFIRKLLSEIFSAQESDRIRILYGGSVKPENIKGLMSQSDIDGALVGGASLSADNFAAIVRNGK